MKEKYKEIVCGFNDERTENVANRCVEIAEEFAVKFAEFIDFEYYQHKYRCNTYAESLEDFEIDKTYSVKELLKIFKKEKGL